jgi:pimeloyl-ACP methyl ester carboxylesterase
MAELAQVQTPVLDVAYEASGPEHATPVILLHGFPYDPRSFDQVVPILNRAGLRTIVPYVRGYGPTRFLSADTMRSGQQAALAHDVLDLLDALHLDQAVLAGFDWGARSACILAALWPARVRALISCCGYIIQDIAQAANPVDPEQERRLWYQYYFNTERGRAGLGLNRVPLCRLLWTLWSPTWPFDEAVYARTARSFDNPDFVDVAVHSYRHRYGVVLGDPRYAETEARLAVLPKIAVPAITLHGAVDGVTPAATSGHHKTHFSGRYERRVLQNIGHDVPREAPAAFAQAVLDASGW